MPVATPTVPYPRLKRRHLTDPPPARKRIRLSYPSQQEKATAYWNALSRHWLTRSALEELDRRNNQTSSSVQFWHNPGAVAVDKYTTDPLKRLSRNGGPDLRDLRGYSQAQPANSTVQPMPTGPSASGAKSNTRNTVKEPAARTCFGGSTAYDKNFEQHLEDHGIHGPRRQKPKNFEQIQGHLAKRRASLSPSKFTDDAFDNFQQASNEVLNEAMMMRTTFPTVMGDADFFAAGEVHFTNLEPLTDGTLNPARPDHLDGARPGQIDPNVRGDLDAFVVPASQKHGPAVPNFFVEAKGPDGSAAVATRQACYDGALGARGIHELASVGKEPGNAGDDNAYTITATYLNGGLKIYTTHPTPSSNSHRPLDFHMAQLGGWDLTGSRDQYQQGASAFRNARDWAKNQRDTMIAVANSRAHGARIETSAEGPIYCASKISNGALQDLDVPEPPPSTRTKRKSSKNIGEAKGKKRRNNMVEC